MQPDFLFPGEPKSDGLFSNETVNLLLFMTRNGTRRMLCGTGSHLNKGGSINLTLNTSAKKRNGRKRERDEKIVSGLMLLSLAAFSPPWFSRGSLIAGKLRQAS